MSSEPAIVTEGLSKQYRIGAKAQGRMLREALVDAVKRVIRPARREFPSVWALRDVSCRIEKGEVVGIIGRNGAGKTTLLKLLSRITRPTEGRLAINGRVAPLVEVGTGFHNELTGRENVFLNGSILGMRRKEIAERFDAIVEFSGVGDFIDTPIKRYSSGMRLRLGFAVAAHLAPDVLLVDEILAVGDAEFQRKCLGRLGDVGNDGRTVLFVSHNLEAVEQLCPRTLWIDGGRIRRDGATREVIASYLADTSESQRAAIDLSNHALRSGTGEARITALEFLDTDGEPLEVVRSGEAIVLRMRFDAEREVRSPHFGIVFSSDLGTLVAHTNTWSDRYETPVLSTGPGLIDLRIDLLTLMPGRYSLSIWIEQFGEGQSCDLLEHCTTLEVHAPAGDQTRRTLPRRAGLVFFPSSWRLEQ